jgi:hypothetical protein
MHWILARRQSLEYQLILYIQFKRLDPMYSSRGQLCEDRMKCSNQIYRDMEYAVLTSSCFTTVAEVSRCGFRTSAMFSFDNFCSTRVYGSHTVLAWAITTHWHIAIAKELKYPDALHHERDVHELTRKVRTTLYSSISDW